MNDITGGTEEDKKELDKSRGWTLKGAIERQKEKKLEEDEKKRLIFESMKEAKSEGAGEGEWVESKGGRGGKTGGRGGRGGRQVQQQLRRPEPKIENQEKISELEPEPTTQIEASEFEKRVEAEEHQISEAVEKLRLFWKLLEDHVFTSSQITRVSAWPLIHLEQGEHPFFLFLPPLFFFFFSRELVLILCFRVCCILRIRYETIDSHRSLLPTQTSRTPFFRWLSFRKDLQVRRRNHKPRGRGRRRT